MALGSFASKCVPTLLASQDLSALYIVRRFLYFHKQFLYKTYRRSTQPEKEKRMPILSWVLLGTIYLVLYLLVGGGFVHFGRFIHQSEPDKDPSLPWQDKLFYGLLRPGQCLAWTWPFSVVGLLLMLILFVFYRLALSIVRGTVASYRFVVNGYEKPA